MCTRTCLEFVAAHLSEQEVHGCRVIEVGARNVNGSARGLIEAFRPASYLGVDIESGPGVDEICDATGLVDRFGRATFDILISTELLEHVRDWKTVISQFKQILKPRGVLLITTRSPGFPYHAFPADFWRYEVSDLRTAFSDFSIETLESDPLSPGVFLKARKPIEFAENNTRNQNLYSMITGQRAFDITDEQIASFLCRWKLRQIIRMPERLVRRFRNRLLGRKADPDHA